MEIDQSVHTVVTDNYRIIANKAKNTSDFPLTARVIPINRDEKKYLGGSTFIVPVVNASTGMEDLTNITSKCDLNVVMIGSSGNTKGNNRYIKSRFAFLIPKEIEETDTDTYVADDIKQDLDGTGTDDSYKSVKSENGETGIFISDNSGVIKSGDTKIIISEDGITFMGEKKSYSLPKESSGLVKETGFLRTLPSVFAIPPTALHNIPDMSIPLKVARLTEAVSEFRGVT